MTRLVRKGSGDWAEGRASPTLLREDLRRLPGDYVTKEVGDEHRVHELDPPHIVDALVEDREKAEQEPTPDEPKLVATRFLEALPVGVKKPVSQRRVDWIRLRVMKSVVSDLCERESNGESVTSHDFRVRHLWFPEDNANHYGLRDGNPPPDSERPKYLRGIDLVVDILCPPVSVKDAAAAVGHDLNYDLRSEHEH